jgi:hypothetical protein
VILRDLTATLRQTLRPRRSRRAWQGASGDSVLLMVSPYGRRTRARSRGRWLRAWCGPGRAG